MASLIPPVVKKTVTGDYGYTQAQVPNLSGKVALITGGTNGIGLSLARTLYSHGASLYVLGHQEEVASRGVNYIKSGILSDAPEDFAKGFEESFGNSKDESGDGGETPGKVEFVQVNLEDLKDVAKVGKELAGKLDRLDITALIAGKGVNESKLTGDGLDSHLTVNNLSHHLLLSHLLPVIRKTAAQPDADVRIVSMSSELHRATGGGPGMFGGKFRDEKEFSELLGPNNAYARTKLCVILFTRAVVQRHLKSESPILAYATHPGAVSTGQQDQFKPAYGETVGSVMSAVVRPFMRKPSQGVLGILWASVAPEARSKEYENGTYFTDPAELGQESGEAKDQELVDNFYTQSDKLIKRIVGEENMGPW